MLLVNILHTFFFLYNLYNHFLNFHSHPAKKMKLDGELKETMFGDLLEKSLGSVPSIIFWSDQQLELITNITSMKHTLLTGDYGTGDS